MKAAPKQDTTFAATVIRHKSYVAAFAIAAVAVAFFYSLATGKLERKYSATAQVRLVPASAPQRGFFESADAAAAYANAGGLETTGATSVSASPSTMPRTVTLTASGTNPTAVRIAADSAARRLLKVESSAIGPARRGAEMRALDLEAQLEKTKAMHRLAVLELTRARKYRRTQGKYRRTLDRFQLQRSLESQAYAATMSYLASRYSAAVAQVEAWQTQIVDLETQIVDLQTARTDAMTQLEELKAAEPELIPSQAAKASSYRQLVQTLLAALLLGLVGGVAFATWKDEHGGPRGSCSR